MSFSVYHSVCVLFFMAVSMVFVSGSKSSICALKTGNKETQEQTKSAMPPKLKRKGSAKWESDEGAKTSLSQQRVPSLTVVYCVLGEPG